MGVFPNENAAARPFGIPINEKNALVTLQHSLRPQCLDRVHA